MKTKEEIAIDVFRDATGIYTPDYLDLITKAMEAYAAQYRSLHIEQEQKWFSPIQEEREWQEKGLKELWPNYPNDSPLWQYMNGLIRGASRVGEQEQEIERLRSRLAAAHTGAEIRINELEEACRTVVNGYEMDGMEQMDTRDHVAYKYCKKALESSPIKQPEAQNPSVLKMIEFLEKVGFVVLAKEDYYEPEAQKEQDCICPPYECLLGKPTRCKPL